MPVSAQVKSRIKHIMYIKTQSLGGYHYTNELELILELELYLELRKTPNSSCKEKKRREKLQLIS